MAQSSENPPFHHLHAHLDFGFISGAGLGWDHRHVIMLGEIEIGPVEGGLVAMRPTDGGLQVIRDKDLWHPTKCRKGADMRADPIRETLTPGRFSKGIVGGAKDGDEDRGVADFTREGIDDRHGLASVVHKERLARPVALPHDQIELSSPLAIRLTKLAVLEAIGGDGLVFLPQQEQSDTFAFALLVHMAQSGVGRLAMGVWVAVANSRPSRAVSSRVSGRGQDRPAACARRT